MNCSLFSGAEGRWFESSWAHQDNASARRPREVDAVNATVVMLVCAPFAASSRNTYRFAMSGVNRGFRIASDESAVVELSRCANDCVLNINRRPIGKRRTADATLVVERCRHDSGGCDHPVARSRRT
jgi:hypothetical protein